VLSCGSFLLVQTSEGSPKRRFQLVPIIKCNSCVYLCLSDRFSEFTIDYSYSLVILIEVIALAIHLFLLGR